jgi:hypothetical protein
VLIEKLPTGSATWCARAGVPYGWTLTDLLLADVFEALAGTPHPMKQPLIEEQRKAEHEETVRRLVEQRERIARDRGQTPPSE